jgi:hypothetical protein
MAFMPKQLHSIKVECPARVIVLDQNTEPTFVTDFSVTVRDDPVTEESPLPRVADRIADTFSETCDDG